MGNNNTLNQNVKDDFPNKLSDDVTVERTTLLHHKGENNYALATNTIAVKGSYRRKWKRTKQKPKIDEVKNISVTQMRLQMLDTTDVVTVLNPAPQTKRAMHLRETGRVEKLFGLPARPLLARSLFRGYQRNLISQPTGDDDFSLASELDKENMPLGTLREADSYVDEIETTSSINASKSSYITPCKIENHTILKKKTTAPTRKAIHRQKSNHYCLMCSYSTWSTTLLNIHVQRDHPLGKDSDEELSIDLVDLTTPEPPLLEEMRENAQNFDDKESVTSSSSPPDLGDRTTFDFEQKRQQQGTYNYSRIKEDEGRCAGRSFISDQYKGFQLCADSDIKRVHQNSDEEYPYRFQRSKCDSSTTSSPVAGNESKSSGFDTKKKRVQKRTGQDLMRQFGLRESFVKLHNIIDLAKLQLARNDGLLDSTNSNTTRQRIKRKYESKELVEKKSKSKIEEEVNKTTLSRVEFMEKKAQIAVDDLKKSKLNKDNLLNKIKDITSKKTEAEIELRINQCKSLELKMSLLDFPEVEDYKNSLASMEELMEKLERVVEGMHYELEALRKKEAELSYDVEDAERSHSGIMEVLAVLQLELKGL